MRYQEEAIHFIIKYKAYNIYRILKLLKKKKNPEMSKCIQLFNHVNPKQGKKNDELTCFGNEPIPKEREIVFLNDIFSMHFYRYVVGTLLKHVLIHYTNLCGVKCLVGAFPYTFTAVNSFSKSEASPEYSSAFHISKEIRPSSITEAKYHLVI